MSGIWFELIVDTNVALSTVLAQSLSGKAIALLDSVADGQRIAHVPDLFFAELASGLATQVKHPKINLDRTEAVEYLRDINALPWVVTPCRQLAGAALEIAGLHKISSYDAMYVALSERIGVPFVTGDKKLQHNLSNTNYRIVAIDDVL
jgi:predicted nucleic acid-binding protein